MPSNSDGKHAGAAHVPTSALLAPPAGHGGCGGHGQ